MNAKELKTNYLEFFKRKAHAIIPSASLVPQNDPSVLFTTAGMHPLVPYLLGEAHPLGKRLVNVQKSFRTADIDEVGDASHHTFFEMLGNWSLGDYWKKDSISWSYEFLTQNLKIDPSKLWVTCFAGDRDALKDTESADVWESLGIPGERIFFLGKEDNWWGPPGTSGPCGPDTEIFYDISGKAHGENCRPGDGCGRFTEIWNNVFMQYEKTKEGKFVPLKQKNVDTGMGVERTTAVLAGLEDNYQVEELWGEIIASIEKVSARSYEQAKKEQRIIADHLRAATFIISDGVEPSNKERGYVLRRLIRRAIRFAKVLEVEKPFVQTVAQAVIDAYKDDYPQLEKSSVQIKEILSREEIKFMATLQRGLKEIEKLEKIDAKRAFYLYETYGFPLELTEEIALEKGQKINKKEFEREFENHKTLSRTASSGMFKGGLAEASGETTKLHTATHLLHASLRRVLGEHVSQKGSNITSERLRFDFSHPEKLTEDQLRDVESLINEQIKKDLKVDFEEKSLEDAKKEGALAFFGERYADKVKVYSIGDFSKEVCGGPHVTSTGVIGRVRITKQEKIGSGVIRIYTTVGS